MVVSMVPAAPLDPATVPTREGVGHRARAAVVVEVVVAAGFVVVGAEVDDPVVDDDAAVVVVDDEEGLDEHAPRASPPMATHATTPITRTFISDPILIASVNRRSGYLATATTPRIPGGHCRWTGPQRRAEVVCVDRLAGLSTVAWAAFCL